MKNLKKILALVLALALVVTAFAACGNSGTESKTESSAADSKTEESKAEESKEEESTADSGELRPCRIVQPGTLAPDYETGMAAVNEKLKADGVGIEVEVIRIPWDAYAEKLNLMLTTGEPFELLHVMQDVKNISAIAGMDAIIPIDEYLDKYPDLVAKFSDKEWKGAVYNGQHYAVPCYWKPMDNVMCYMNYRADIAEKAGYKEFPDTVDGIIDLMEKSQQIILEENGIKAYNWFHQTQDVAHWLHRSYSTYPFYVDNTLGMILARQDGTIDSFYESEEFKQDAHIYETMYKKGLVHPDVLSLDHQKKYDEADFGGFLPSNTFDPNQEVNCMEKAGIETDVQWVRTFPEQPDMIYTYVQNLNAISATSDDPETGLKFLDWLYKSDENHDLFHYGIKGTHYTEDENGRIDQVKDESGAIVYQMDTWMTGYVPYINYGKTMTDDSIDYTTYESDNYVVSPIAGFLFDASNVQSELTNLQTEIIASIYPIKFGIVNYEENIDDALAKMKAAGLDAYMEEYRTQFAAYLEANPNVLEDAKGTQK